MAMGSRFELVLEGENEAWLRAAGEEALREIQRLDRQLTIFDASSEVSRLNARASYAPVAVEPRLFDLLVTSRRLSQETGGAFDVTVGPLMRAWGFFGASGHLPAQADLDAARTVTGMDLVELDAPNRSVRFARPGVMIDLGAIGKGYAVDEAVALLREAGVERAFLHGGTSTSFGLGTPEGETAWRVSLSYPGFDRHDDQIRTLAVVSLADSSLSVSAVQGKWFSAAGEVYGHVLDPRLGRPVTGALQAAVACSSATEADAYATALLVEGARSADLLSGFDERVKALLLLASSEPDSYEVIESGLSCLPSNRCRVRQPDHRQAQLDK